MMGRLFDPVEENSVTESARFDPLSDEFLRDPIPVLNRMRRSGDAYRHEDLHPVPAVSILGYRAVKSVYRDFKAFTSYIPEEARRIELADGVSLLGEDPPAHTHLRGAVNKVFTAHAIDALEAEVQVACDRLFDAVLDHEEFDMVEDLAARLTVFMISKLVGVSEEGHARIRDWTLRQAAINGASVWFPAGDPRFAELERITREANDEMQAYFGARVDERLKEPQDDILSLLVQSDLNRQEAISFAKLLVMAGNETTTNLINNTVALLIDHPEQERILRDEPELTPGAVEEVLRIRGPVNYSGRTAARDAEVDGVKIRAGEGVVLWVAAANHDERVYEHPERFDVRRAPRGVLAFGHGIHACLGSPLARLEGRVFLSTLLRRTRALERTRPEMEPIPTPIFNGVRHQYVRFHPA